MKDAVTGPGPGARSSEDEDRTNRRTITPTPAETEREGGRGPAETGRDSEDGAERRVVSPTPQETTDARTGSAYDGTGAVTHTGAPTPGTARSTADLSPGTDTGTTDTGATNTGATNTGTTDTGTTDTGATNTGATNTGTTDTGTTDTGIGGSRTHTGGTGIGAGGSGSRTGGTAAGGAGTGTPLLPHDECDKLETRLRHAVAGFVDGPRDAVQEADQVLEEIAGRFAEAVTRRRRTLRMSWQDGKSGGADEAARTDTEQLRLALKDYRELAERLLHG
ncbi:hypothetical protein [Streptomyces panaciradicis]|uniref:hypothetical protein n=1 Tax=Streptomyces panaciradicis TaxID=1470261 RepID=UPI0027E4DBD7|nr:hypothetical protein [Streptomyces panaciradicis]